MRNFKLIISLFAISLVSCTNQGADKQIIGKWQFVKFYTKEDPTKDMQAELDEHNSLNKELTIRFSPSGEFESDQPGGPEENNKIADYKLLPGNRLLIEKDTLSIIRVDDTYLSLSKDDNLPEIMFRRINNTGTEPGRR